MRGRIFISVLLGLSLAALPAFATRYPRGRPTRDSPGKPDRPGHAMERSRPGDDSGQVTRSRASATSGSQGRVQERSRSGARPAFAIGKPGQVSNSSRMVCNEAEECHMSAAGARVAISRAAASRGPGNGGFGKINNAKGKSMVGNRTMSMRSVCNEADECSLGKAGAQAIIFKAAHSRGPGYASNTGKISNAKGKSMLGRAMPTDRMACNEADECSMGNSGAKAEWQKAEQRSRRH